MRVCTYKYICDVFIAFCVYDYICFYPESTHAILMFSTPRSCYLNTG